MTNSKLLRLFAVPVALSLTVASVSAATTKNPVVKAPVTHLTVKPVTLEPRIRREQSRKMFYEGMNFVRAGKSTEAISKFQQAIGLWSTDPVYFNELGVAYQQRGGNGDYEMSEKALRHSLTMAPKNAASWCNLGACLNHSNDRKGAEEAYKKALEIEPNDWHAHQNLAVTYYVQQKMTDARAEFAKTISLKPPAAIQESAQRSIKDIDGMIALNNQSKATGKESNSSPAAEVQRTSTSAQESKSEPKEPKLPELIPDSGPAPLSEPSMIGAPTPGTEEPSMEKGIIELPPDHGTEDAPAPPASDTP